MARNSNNRNKYNCGKMAYADGIMLDMNRVESIDRFSSSMIIVTFKNGEDKTYYCSYNPKKVVEDLFKSMK